MKWKKFKGEELPQSAMDFLAEADINFMTGWCEAWYVGDVETSKDWFIVTPDGGYYKVDAIAMTWHRCSTGKVVGMCSWTKISLYRARLEYFKTHKFPRDPNYQT